jgi:hypothetical protein
METVTSHRPATDTGLGFYDRESPPLHTDCGIITSVKEKDTFHINVVIIPILQSMLIRIKYKIE